MARQFLHPTLRALLRVMAAPDSALALALGGYAGSFVRWHLWDAVCRNLIPQAKVREIWSRESWGLRSPEWPIVIPAMPFDRMAMLYYTRVRSLTFPRLAPDGCMFREGFREAERPDEKHHWVLRVWDPARLHREGHHPTDDWLGEVANRLDPNGGSVADWLLGAAVAWGTNELFVVLTKWGGRRQWASGPVRAIPPA
jgi:hypothetical protein